MVFQYECIDIKNVSSSDRDVLFTRVIWLDYVMSVLLCTNIPVWRHILLIGIFQTGVGTMVRLRVYWAWCDRNASFASCTLFSPAAWCTAGALVVERAVISLSVCLSLSLALSLSLSLCLSRSLYASVSLSRAHGEPCASGRQVQSFVWAAREDA